MSKAYWAVAQISAGMENLVRRDIEDGGGSAFLPTYAVTRVRRGRKIESNRPLVPGYVFFFQTSTDDVNAVAAIKGVGHVLADADDVPLRVHPMEMHRLMLENASGAHDRSEAYQVAAASRRQRSRKPRRSKRARISLHP